MTTGPVAALSSSSRAIVLFAYALVVITIVPSRLASLDREIVSTGALMRFAPLCTVTVIVPFGTSFLLVRTATRLLPALVKVAANGKPIAPDPSMYIVSLGFIRASQKYAPLSHTPLSPALLPQPRSRLPVQPFRGRNFYQAGVLGLRRDIPAVFGVK